MQIVPFTSDPQSTITVSLGLEKFQLTTRYNERGFWSLDVLRVKDSRLLVAGVPILLGQDILGSYALGIGGLVATDKDGHDVDAGPDDLGSRVIVTYFSASELAVLASQGFFL